MTNIELIRQLAALNPSADVMIVAADFGKGDDSFAPLDRIDILDEQILLGSTILSCGTQTSTLAIE